MQQKPEGLSHPIEWRGDDSLGVYFLRIEGVENLHFRFNNSPDRRETVIVFGEDEFVLIGNFTVEYRNFVDLGLRRGLTPEQLFDECKYFYDKNPAFQPAKKKEE